MLVELGEIAKLRVAEVAFVGVAVPCCRGGFVGGQSTGESTATTICDHPLRIGDGIAGVVLHHVVVDHLAGDPAWAGSCLEVCDDGGSRDVHLGAPRTFVYLGSMD